MSDRRDSITAQADSMAATDLEIHDLRMRLEEAQETLAALHRGDLDAVVVHDQDGETIYSQHTADRPYRLFLERMKQGALTLSPDGVILYCNHRFADLIGAPLTRGPRGISAGIRLRRIRAKRSSSCCGWPSSARPKRKSISLSRDAGGNHDLHAAQRRHARR
jgi:PAS domain-containing protein